MNTKKRPFWAILLSFLVFLLALSLYAIPGDFLRIRNAFPFLFLSVLVAYSSFASVWQGGLVGFLCGAFADSMVSRSYCFHSILFFLFGVGVCLLANNIFNKNLKGITALSFLCCTLYYVCYWLVFILPGTQNATENFNYLFRYALPSALYSAVFILPLYYLYRFLFRIKQNNN